MGRSHLERAEQTLIHAHHGPSVVEFSAVVGCAEQSDELALRKELVAVLDHLMGAADEVHVVFLEETRHHVGAKGEADTAVVFGPSRDILVGIRPQQVAEQATIGNLETRLSVPGSRRKPAVLRRTEGGGWG